MPEELEKLVPLDQIPEKFRGTRPLRYEYRSGYEEGLKGRRPFVDFETWALNPELQDMSNPSHEAFNAGVRAGLKAGGFEHA